MFNEFRQKPKDAINHLGDRSSDLFAALHLFPFHGIQYLMGAFYQKKKKRSHHIKI